MKLNTVLKAYRYNIVNGDTFLLKCWPNTHIIDILKGNAKVTIYYNLNTLCVHEINLKIKNIENIFKWFNKKSLKLYKQYAIDNKITIEENNPTVYSLYQDDKPSFYVSKCEILSPEALKLLA